MGIGSRLPSSHRVLAMPSILDLLSAPLLARPAARSLALAFALVGLAAVASGAGARAGELAPELNAAPTPAAPTPAAPSASVAPAAPVVPSAPTAAVQIDPRSLVGSVVQIRTMAVRDGQTVASLGLRRSGSGVIIGPSTVLTIGYLLLEADEVEVLTAAGKRIPASVAAQDPISGIGIVRTALPLDGTPILLGNAESLAEGDTVLTLGHGEPIATELLVVSRKVFSGSWEYLLEKPLMTFPPVNNWSGAALFSKDGKLVGIGSMIVNDAGPPGSSAVPGNLFVPVSLVAPVLESLLAEGKRPGPSRPWLGISTEAVRGNLMVARVTPAGPAALAGLAPGDIILGVGDEAVASREAFYRKVWAFGPAGSEIPVRVLKDGTIRELKLPSIEREAFLRKPHGV
jgi:S1-C subfamily serine protease